MRGDIRIKKIVDKFLIEVVTFDIAFERIAGRDGLYTRFGEMRCAGRIYKFTAEIGDKLPVTEKTHASRVSDIGHMADFYILFVTIAHEFLHVFCLYDSRHAFLTFRYREFGRVEAIVFGRDTIKVDVKTVCQLADRNTDASRTEVV